MSKLLDNLANNADKIGKIAGVIPGIGSAVSGVADLLGFGGPSQEELQAQALKMQYEYQTKLNEQQQEYARENADTEYQRQRQMTRDQYSLNKQGMLDAGLSPAGDGFQVRNASSPSIASPSAGSVGMPSFDAGLQYKKMDSLINVASLLSNIKKQGLEAEGVALDNALKQGQFSDKLRKLRAETDSAEQRAVIDRIEAAIQENYGLKNAGFDSVFKQVASEFARENAVTQLQQSKQTLQLLRQQYKKGSKELKQIDQAIRYADEEYRQLIVQGVYQPKMLQADLDNKRADTSNKVMDTRLKNANIGLVRAQEQKTRTDTYGVELDNDLKEMTNYNKSRIVEQMFKTQYMKNVPTTVREQIKEAIYKYDVGNLSYKDRQKAVTALDILIEQEQNQRGNENQKSNISYYQALKDLFDVTPYFDIIK